jgi:hypothetical protein
MMFVNKKLLIPKSISTLSYTNLKLNKSRSMPSGPRRTKRGLIIDGSVPGGKEIKQLLSIWVAAGRLARLKL